MTNDGRDTMLIEIHTTTAVTAQKVADHVGNESIHQIPPCESHKTLVGRLWALAVLSVGALCSSLYAVFK